MVATKYGIEIVKHVVNGMTGHHELVVCAVEQDAKGENTIKSVHQTFGIDSQALLDLHGGDIMAFAQSKCENMVKLHKCVQASARNAKQVKGHQLWQK